MCLHVRGKITSWWTYASVSPIIVKEQWVQTEAGVFLVVGVGFLRYTVYEVHKRLFIPLTALIRYVHKSIKKLILSEIKYKKTSCAILLIQSKTREEDRDQP